MLAAARQMLDESARLHDLSLNELARRAAMTKSNVYRYFESREAVFLELMQEAWLEWMSVLPTAFTEQVAHATTTTTTTTATTTNAEPSAEVIVDAIAEAFVVTLAARQHLCMLTAALPTTLEENLSPQTVMAFKQASLESFDAIADMMLAAAPIIPRAAAIQALHDGVALIVGLYPVCYPAPSVRQAIADAPELACFRHDFATELRRLLRATFHDLVRRHLA